MCKTVMILCILPREDPEREVTRCDIRLQCTWTCSVCSRPGALWRSCLMSRRCCHCRMALGTGQSASPGHTSPTG